MCALQVREGLLGDLKISRLPYNFRIVGQDTWRVKYNYDYMPYMGNWTVHLAYMHGSLLKNTAILSQNKTVKDYFGKGIFFIKIIFLIFPIGR